MNKTLNKEQIFNINKQLVKRWKLTTLFNGKFEHLIIVALKRTFEEEILPTTEL